MNVPVNKKRVSIIGTGRVGRSLAMALFETGFDVFSLFNRTVTKATGLASGLKATIVKAFPEERGDLAPVTFVSVPDDAITVVANQLSRISGDWSGYSFIHCSGARQAGELNVLAKLGAGVASFHPIQTFPLEPHSGVFRGIWISLQGDEELLELLEVYGEKIGAKTIRVNADQKKNLHIAAVFVCNYVVTLAAAAKRLLPATGDNDLELLAPLMRQTLDQILAVGPQKALTGPLQRGDLQTLRDHLDSLNEYPELLSLYTSLGRYTVTLVKEMSAKPGNINQVSALFETE